MSDSTTNLDLISQSQQRRKARERHRRWSAANRDRIKAYADARKAREPTTIAQQQRASSARYRETHRETVLSYLKRWRAQNAQRVAEYNKAWNAANPVKRRELFAAWSKNHPHELARKSMQRRQRAKEATPAWVCADDLAMIYRARNVAAISLPELGPLHVDHIIPLKGKRVSGLHVPNNLRILTAVANLAKNNREQAQ